MVEVALTLSEPRWREAVLIFNTQPALWLHDSWFDRLPQGSIARRLRTVPQAAPWVSCYLLRAFGLAQRHCLDFASPWARLALLDGPALERLFLHLGLALRHRDLGQEILGEQLRRLKTALSAAEWNFAVKRAPLLGAIPLFTFEPDTADLRTGFTLIGGRFCAVHLTPFGRPLLARLTLKLPATWSATLNLSAAPAVSGSVTGADLPPLLRKLLKDLLPTWNPLFA